MADFTPQMLPPITGGSMAGMIPFISPDQIAQNQTDMLQWQQKQALAQQLMQAQYQPNTGKTGVGATILERVMGALAQNQQNAKLSDILKQQFQIENSAAQAKRQQDLQDEYRKLQESIYEAQQKAVGEAKAKRENPELKVENGFVIDPSNPNASMAVPGFSDAQIALAGGKANAEAAARARYAGADSAAQLGQIQKIMAMPDSPTKTAMLAKAVGEGGMQAIAFSGMGAGGGQGGAVGGATGDDFLKSLSPPIAAQVKAIGEYRQAPLTSMAMRSPMGAALMQAVNQAYPDYDATAYPTRSKARTAFTSGKEGQALNSMNTAIGHAGELLDAGDALGNTRFPIVNSVLNAGASATGSDAVKNFNLTRDALAGEMTKAFRGTGGSEKDIQEMRDNLSAANSPEQLRGAIGQAMKLLGSKAQSLNEQYRDAFGTASPNFSDPHVTGALQKLSKAGIDLGPLGEAYNIGGSAAAAPAATGVPTLQDIQAELARRGAVSGG